MKATIFKKGNTITIEGTPKEVAECINSLDSEQDITVTTSPNKDWFVVGQQGNFEIRT